jgi:hypothetical protein
MGKLLLHIGSEKTGSKSLQAYLNLSSESGLPFDYLTGAGYMHGYCDYSISAKLALKCYSSSELISDFDFEVLDERIQKIKDNPLPSVLSCELFYRNPNALRVFLSCCKKHSVDLCILSLVRSFSKYCRSLYGEAIKWGEVERPLKWAKRSQESLLSMEALSICADFCPGKTFLWNFDRLIDEVDWVDPILFLLEKSFAQCFKFDRFSDDQIAAFTHDLPHSQSLDPRLLSIMRESNRSFEDSRLTRALLSYLSKNHLVQKALDNSYEHDEPSFSSVRMKREFKQLEKFTESVKHLHSHHLIFSGIKSLYISF